MFWFLIILAVLALIALVTGNLMAFLAVVLIIVAILLIPGVSAFLVTMFPTAFSGLAAVGAGSWIAAAGVLTGAYMLSPETVDSVIESAGEVVSKVGEVGVDVGTDIVKKVVENFKTPLLIVGGIGLFWLFRSSSKNDKSGDKSSDVRKEDESDDYQFNIAQGDNYDEQNFA